MKQEFNEILSLYNEIEVDKKEAANLERIIDENNCKAIQYLKPFIKKWNPVYNEKAVYINFAAELSYYVWFTENRGTYFRFREVPNERKNIFNFVGQEQINSKNENELWSGIIIPLELFTELNKLLKFNVLDKSVY